MEMAQQVNRIGKIAARMAARCFQQRGEIRMAGASLTRDARELGFGNAGRGGPVLADGPMNCHSSPLALLSGEALSGPS